MNCCTFPLYKKGGHILNLWLAHLYNPQLIITTVVGLEGVPCNRQSKGFNRREMLFTCFLSPPNSFQTLESVKFCNVHEPHYTRRVHLIGQYQRRGAL